MILTNRLFTRREPERNAKSIYIFCEGKKREYQYFQYFQGIDSRINIVVHPLNGQENNSPTGLYSMAIHNLLKTDVNPTPKYEILEGDEVWFVIDTDTWKGKVAELRTLCQRHPDWGVVQSNPCFEVWLYFHFFVGRANFPWIEMCDTWKSFLPKTIPGGFHSGKHPIFIGQAIENAEKSFLIENDAPAVGCTDVFKLAKVIYGFCRKKIENIANRI